VSLLADDGLTGGLFIFVRDFTISVHCLFRLALVRIYRSFTLSEKVAPCSNFKNGAPQKI
jgi:hypothetical protein